MRISCLLVFLLLPQPAPVRTSAELRDAAGKAKPGTTILVASGDFEGGVYLANVKGSAGKPIVIAAADPKNPPVFKGGANGLHLTEAEHVELRDLVFTGATANGLNIDDGGSYETPTHHVVLKNLKVRDVGAAGNQDGIKLSGVDDFRVEDCAVERWGRGGSAIDMVGCHRGVIESNTFTHEGANGNGVQMKGGCVDVAVRKNRFDNTGSRGVNIGGSTGLPYFRPPLKDPPHAEAKEIKVEGNTFIGTDAPVAFVGVDGAVVRFNTIWVPRRWAVRILQETTEAGFTACRKGEFSQNLVVFRSNQWGEGGVNIGPGTEPKTFTFAKNWWYCVDEPSRSRPKLPTDEKDGVYGTDPKLKDPEKGDFKLKADSPAKAFGADAFK